MKILHPWVRNNQYTENTCYVQVIKNRAGGNTEEHNTNSYANMYPKRMAE